MRKRYEHIGQFRYTTVAANSSVNICARRWGKSYLVAARVHDNVKEMPGSLGVFVASSFRQAHSRTLPSMLMALADWYGWQKDIHYVIGKTPPKYLGFKEPLFLPSDLKDVIWFYNGTIMVIVSQEVSLSANSMTIHWLVADEAKGLDEKKLSDEILPAVGGSNRYFNDPAQYPHLWGIHFFTDMPTTKASFWLINKYEKFRDDDLYQFIIDQQKDIWEREANGDDPDKIRQLKRELNIIRNKTFYYQERSIFDNIEVVGPEYVDRCARDLPKLVFKSSILCQRIDETDQKFYVNFDPNIHTYAATDLKLLDSYKSKAYDCLLDTDTEPDRPLAIAFDYNAQINWLVVGQMQGKALRMPHSFFTKGDRRLREVVQDFCAYYRPHRNRTVYYYYDATAKGVNYIERGHDAVFTVTDELKRNGWTVVGIDLGTPMHHDKKHLIINNAFQGSEALFPMLNKDGNEALIQAIPLTGITINSLGFRKDKSGEKTPESPGTLPYELRTDGTDAMDTLILGCLTKPYDTNAFVWV